MTGARTSTRSTTQHLAPSGSEPAPRAARSTSRAPQQVIEFRQHHLGPVVVGAPDETVRVHELEGWVGSSIASGSTSVAPTASTAETSYRYAATGLEGVPVPSGRVGAEEVEEHGPFLDDTRQPQL